MARRKLIGPLVALATLALVISASGASAAPHNVAGEAHTVCEVNGSVELDGGGLTMELGSNDHYTFTDASLECLGQEGGTYAVEASGPTDDYEHLDIGENCAQGGSAETDDGELHTGALTATGAQDLVGNVHFVRLGEAVLADGPLWEGTTRTGDPDHYFLGEFVFTPTEGSCASEPGVTAASLDGRAEIFDPYVHTCGEDPTVHELEHGHTDTDHCPDTNLP